MYGLFGRALVPVVAFVLYVAWRLADRADANGKEDTATRIRAAVVLVAIYPLFWTLREVYLSLGALALGYSVLASSVLCALLVLGSWAGRRLGGRGLC